jgi:hypothetical protein
MQIIFMALFAFPRPRSLRGIILSLNYLLVNPFAGDLGKHP